MSNTTYSREFLQGYKDDYRRKIADAHIDQWTGDILRKARDGHTEWSYDIGAWRRTQEQSAMRTYPPTYVPANEEIAEGFMRKFPRCDVVFAEDWVEVRPGTRELQTRVILSWK